MCDRFIFSQKISTPFKRTLYNPFVSSFFFLLSPHPFRGRRKRDKIFLPYRAPIKIGGKRPLAVGRRRGASWDDEIVLAKKTRMQRRRVADDGRGADFRGSLF